MENNSTAHTVYNRKHSGGIRLSVNPPNAYLGFVEYFRRGDAKETFATKFGFYKIEDPCTDCRNTGHPIASTW